MNCVAIGVLVAIVMEAQFFLVPVGVFAQLLVDESFQQLAEQGAGEAGIGEM